MSIENGGWGGVEEGEWGDVDKKAACNFVGLQAAREINTNY